MTISCKTEGAEIYYTTEGDTLPAEGTKYTGPITVNESTVIEAIAVLEGMPNSGTVFADYKIAYQLKYDANGGSGEKDPMNVFSGDIYTFPNCTFTKPKGKTFDHWKMSGVDGDGSNENDKGEAVDGIFHQGDTIIIANNCQVNGVVTVTAYWKDVPAAVVRTSPKEKDLTYTGESQELVTAGEAEDGTMAYAIGTDGTKAPDSGWTASVPQGTDIGTWYVWYKALGDDSHSDSDAGCCIVTIKKATPDAPAAPEAESVTSTGVTLKKTAGYQYSMEGSAWQNSNVFDGLTKDTEYTFYQRIAGDTAHDPSPSSEGAKIRTAAVAYSMVKAEGTEQTTGEIRELVVRIKRSENDDQTFNSYTGAEMDGKALTAREASAAKGSLILTVTKEYMETLAAGDHTLKVKFTDGDVEIPVKIKAAPPTPTPTPKPMPKTGDTADLLLWGGMVLLGIIGIAVAMTRFGPRKKKK